MASSTQADLRDQAASRIGQYLLQGYRMLANHCDNCGTVMVQKQSMKAICVLCDEILPTSTTTDQIPITDKDGSHVSNNDITTQTIVPSSIKKEQSPSSIPLNTEKFQEFNISLEHTQHVLMKQLSLATKQLEECGNSIECNVQLCRLIKECAEALKAIKNI